MTFIHKTLIIPSVLDSCFISSTVSEVKRGEVVYTTSLRMVCEVFCKRMRRTYADFSHAPPNEYSPSPDDKKQWSLVWLMTRSSGRWCGLTSIKFRCAL
ncbi:hypothetical protein Tco_1084225 [Tanacetum coccineum]